MDKKFEKIGNRILGLLKNTSLHPFISIFITEKR